MSIDKLLHYHPGADVNWPNEHDWDTLEWRGPGEKPLWSAFAALPWPPVPTLPEAQALRLAELADVRWQRECAGFVFNGVPIQTDRETQAMLHAARTWALEDPEFTVNYKAQDGLFIPADAATISAIADLAKSHVQACFNHEAALTAAILAAADIEALDAIDITAGWPGGDA